MAIDSLALVLRELVHIDKTAANAFVFGGDQRRDRLRSESWSESFARFAGRCGAEK